jgi:hypothetical protein
MQEPNMMRKSLPFFCFLSFLWSLPPVSAHYLWVTMDTRVGKHGAANIYFEDSPSAGDGHYLDHFATTSKTWFRSVERIEPQLLETSDIRQQEKRWLQVLLPARAPRSIDCYGKFGVYRYGNTNVLLHYYARYVDVDTHEDLHELGGAEHMDLEIVPHDEEAQVELTVRWRGKPAAGRTVYIRGPKKFRKNLKTDERGAVRFTPAQAGRYTFRSSVEEDISGREGDKDYSLIRHNATLVMTLPLQK